MTPLPFAALAALPRTESWKYTSLDFLKSRALSSPGAGVATPEPLIADAYRMVFVDGVFEAARSSRTLPSCFSHDATLAPADAAENPIATVNAAARDGATIALAPGAIPDRALELVFIGTGGESHNWLSITLANNAELTLVEHHVYANACTSTTMTRIEGEGSSRLRHYRLFEADPDSVSLASTTIRLAKDAQYEAFSLISGGRLSRHEIHADLNGPGAEIHLNGAHVLSGDSHADTTSEIRHMAPHCTSRETYRHVMDGHARSVFQGKIFVAEGAQKTDGFQLNQSLMLSPNAEVNAKPELEIYADDVKCSHGATSGRLDDEALFYLRSRGIPEDQARGMLVEAFIGASIDLITDETVRTAFRREASRNLASGGNANDV